MHLLLYHLNFFSLFSTNFNSSLLHLMKSLVVLKSSSFFFEISKFAKWMHALSYDRVDGDGSNKPVHYASFSRAADMHETTL